MSFKTPTTAQMDVLASLSDAELLAPISLSDAAPTKPSPTSEVRNFDSSYQVPILVDLLRKADEVAAAQTTAELPRTPPRPTSVPAGENVSQILRGNGARLSEALRQAVGEHIKTADDLRYALRVFAAHSVSSLISNRRNLLSRQEYEASAFVHEEWQQRILKAVKGEVAAVQAAKHLSAEEFTFMLELVDSNRAGMAQNLAGPDVDVSAVAAGRGMDWRELAHDWATACKSRGSVTFETGKTVTGWTSYSIEVQPEGAWILSVYVDQQWIPVEASEAGAAQALAARKQVMLARSASALPRPYLGNVFPDKLGDSV